MSRPPRKTDKHSLPPFHFFPPLHFLGLTGPTGETVSVHSPASVELHVRIEQGDDGGGGGSPAADSGPDQPFLLVVTNHFDEARAVLTVGLVHKALQVLLQLRWTGGGTNTNKTECYSHRSLLLDQTNCSLILYFTLLKLFKFF